MKLTRIHYEIIKFIIVGGINTFNYYITYLFLLKVLHVNYMVSHIVGFIVSFIISYYLNCYFVYKVNPIIIMMLMIIANILIICSSCLNSTSHC